MHAFFSSMTIATLFALVPCLAGCGQSHRHDGQVAAHDEHDHDHDELGPHGGALIELGSESYHAELVHDDQTHTVTVFLLDGTAKQPAPAGQLPKDVRLNVMIGSTPRQYSLPRVEDNCYSIVDESLCDNLCDNADARARLNATIGGKPFVGNIEPHEHEGHEHGHAHADGHHVR